MKKILQLCSVLAISSVVSSTIVSCTSLNYKSSGQTPNFQKYNIPTGYFVSGKTQLDIYNCVYNQLAIASNNSIDIFQVAGSENQIIEISI